MNGIFSGNGHVVRRPGIPTYFILSTARIASNCAAQLQQQPIAHAHFVQTPSSRESAHAAANDGDGCFALLARTGERGTVAQLMSDGAVIIHKAAGNSALCLFCEPDQRWSRDERRQKLATRNIMLDLRRSTRTIARGHFVVA